MPSQLHLQEEPGDPDHWCVKDDAGELVGTIDRIGPDQWRNTPIQDGDQPMSPVAIGPFATREAAFTEYRIQLTGEERDA